MRILILSDIHGVLPALEAVLATPEAQACDAVFSLGDHTGFGPQPREVQRRLEELQARMLLGNHEERLHHVPDFPGYNWTMLHWTARQMEGLNVDFPVDERLGPVWLTHGTPGDPYHIIERENLTAEMTAVLDALPEGVTHLLSGHNHIPWQIEHRGRTAFNPCSVGIPEDGEGGVAPFAVMTLAGDEVTLVRHQARYDLREAGRAFLTSGAVQAAPEMCRATYQTMCTGEYQGVLKVVRHVIRTAQSMGLSLGDQAAWEAADRTYPWLHPMSTADFWKRTEEALL